MFKPAPGADGNKLIARPGREPGRAQRRRQDLDLQAARRREVRGRHADHVEGRQVRGRALDRQGRAGQRPDLLRRLPGLGQDYKGPYKSKGVDTTRRSRRRTTARSSSTSRQPFGGFDYFAMLPMTVPVPEAKDTGRQVPRQAWSPPARTCSTPTRPGKGFTLKRNPNWDPATDPNRKALPDGYKVTLNVNADDIDNQLLSGDLDVDIAGTGVQPASLRPRAGRPDAQGAGGQPVGGPALVHLDHPARSSRSTTSTAARPLSTPPTAPVTSPPTAASSPVATSPPPCSPPQIPGYKKFDLYPAGADNKGDVAKAKDALAACGQPNGFETKMAYRAERPKEKATAESLQQSLAKVGIKLTLTPLPDEGLLLAVRRQAGLTGRQRRRPGHQRLGRGLERRLRHAVADRRQPGHPGHRWLVQPERADPRGRRPARQGGRPSRTSTKRERDLGPDRQGGHGQARTSCPASTPRRSPCAARSWRTCSSTRRSGSTTTWRWASPKSSAEVPSTPPKGR